jgi:UDP-N-acetylmuramoyl-L-alanyl-D-glutamate--2,6-diaminopimelate ligase
MVVTSDNPRSEPPESIIEQILVGIPSDMQHKVRVQPMRDQAITQTLREAQAGDVVLIAGKGHEPDQLISDGRGGIRRVPHDDRVLARSVLEALRKEGSCA